jgi:hypothetical protein
VSPLSVDSKFLGLREGASKKLLFGKPGIYHHLRPKDYGKKAPSDIKAKCSV